MFIYVMREIFINRKYISASRKVWLQKFILSRAFKSQIKTREIRQVLDRVIRVSEGFELLFQER